MNDNPREASFMQQAAAKNIKDLQAAVSDLQGSAVSAKTEADAAKKAAGEAKEEARRWKALTRIMGVFVLITLVASGLSIYNWVKQADATNQFRQQVINSCQIGNDRAAGTVTALRYLILALEGPHPTAKIQAEAAAIEREILSANEQRNCQQAYRPNSDPSSPGALPANIKAAAYTTPMHQVVELKNWNGQCLSVPNANPGTKVVVVPCGRAHDWWYFPTTTGGTFRPAGHAGVAIGDSGAHAALQPYNNNGTDISVDAFKRGRSGYTYDRMYITVLHANGRLHAEGTNGAGVNIQRAASNAEYYAILSTGANTAAGTETV